MHARDAIRNAIQSAQMIVTAYLEDLSDADILVRPVPGANHIAWQMGHLIKSEHDMVEMACPGSMPALPAGFEAKYTPETSTLDDPAAFHGKAELQRLWNAQREGTLAALEKQSDTDLDKPAPEPFRSFVNSLGDLFGIQAGHAMMHAGQWAVVRRKLGRKPLF